MVTTGSLSRRFGFEVSEDLVGMRFRGKRHLRMTDQITGYFRGGGFNTAVANAHAAMAQKVQDKAVEILRQKVAATGRPQLSEVSRPGREANRLEASILHQNNRFASASGFIVGRTDWLEYESPAQLYFRIIEEGGLPYATSGFFFSNVPGRPELPSGSRSGIMLGQTLNTTRRPFLFAVRGTRAYHMTARAGDWFGKQQQIINSTYRDHLSAAGCPVPLKRSDSGQALG